MQYFFEKIRYFTLRKILLVEGLISKDFKSYRKIGLIKEDNTMGRKRKILFEDITYDRIGEPVNMDKCPECAEHPDCFACIEGKCTALSESGGQGCVFYMPEQQAIQEALRAYQVLKGKKRYDLIQKYIKAFTALGAKDEEFYAGEIIMAELDKYAADDFAAQLEAEIGGGEKGVS